MSIWSKALKPERETSFLWEMLDIIVRMGVVPSCNELENLLLVLQRTTFSRIDTKFDVAIS